MDKNLVLLAKKMQVLKKKDKETFLARVKKCSVLFDPKSPKSIPECTLDERFSYKIHLIRFLYYKLEGKAYIPYSVESDRVDAQKLRKIAEEKARQEVVSLGISAYCCANDRQKLQFEKIVRRINLLAPFLRKKTYV